MNTKRTLIDARWVKLWRESDPAEDEQENACHRLLFRVGLIGCGLGLVTRNNIGCDWLRVFVREGSVTVWVWRFGVGAKWGSGSRVLKTQT